METLIVTEADLRACLPIDLAALEQVENAFSWIEQKRVSMPPVMHIEIDAQSDVDTKGAYVSGLDSFAVKIASGFFRNPERGLPSCSSTIVLLDSETGFCRCVFLDNGYLMDVRTGLAGAVAAKYLALADVETVGVIGTGAQARYQVESLALVRPFKRLLVHGRNPQKAADYRSDMASRLGVEAAVADTCERLVRDSQVVITTTPATEPIVLSEWCHPGLHITAMGSDFGGKQELDPQILTKADTLACDTRDQCRIGGEIQHLGAQADDMDIVELGALTSGARSIARADTDLTVCDLTGTGVQDTAIAVEAYRRVRAAGLGTVVS